MHMTALPCPVVSQTMQQTLTHLTGMLAGMQCLQVKQPLAWCSCQSQVHLTTATDPGLLLALRQNHLVVTCHSEAVYIEILPCSPHLLLEESMRDLWSRHILSCSQPNSCPSALPYAISANRLEGKAQSARAGTTA